MHSSIRVITTPTVDTPGTALILHVQNKRYLIGNVHEGLQRACIERGVKLSNMSEIFISGPIEWKNTGGLLGCILTLADMNASCMEMEKDKARSKNKMETAEQNNAKTEYYHRVRQKKVEAYKEAGLNLDDFQGSEQGRESMSSVMPSVSIHGARNLMQTLATSRRFIFRKGMPVTVQEHLRDTSAEPLSNRDPDWSDENVQVWKLPIEPISKSNNASLKFQHSRKRSFEDADGDESSPTPSPRSNAVTSFDESLEPYHQELRRNVVTEMFNSAWKSNELIETPLKEVQQPAMMFTRDEKSGKLNRYNLPLNEELPDINVWVRKPWPGAQIKSLPPTQPCRTATSYIFRHHRQRGKFKPKAATDLKVNPVVWSVLESGTSVLSKDGITVSPEMVLEPSRDGGGFAVIDLPSVDYIQPLVGRHEWKSPIIMSGLQAVFWILGSGLSQNTILRQFMENNPNSIHVISSPETSPNDISYDSSSIQTVRLKQIDPERYVVPFHDSNAPLELSRSSNDASSASKVIAIHRDLELRLEPRLDFQEAMTAMTILDTNRIAAQMPEEVLALARVASDEINSARFPDLTDTLPSPNAQIVCLGTGASSPSKYRNVSATFLRIPNHGSYMFDCGEGTVGQLRRLYPPSELGEVLSDLKAIWISHLHADHHLGITSLINLWREVVYEQNHENLRSGPSGWDNFGKKKKLFVFSGSPILSWLQEYAAVENGLLDGVVLVGSRRPIPDAKGCFTFSDVVWDGVHVSPTADVHENVINAVKERTGIVDLSSCYVEHCIGAHAVSITFPTGFKLSYSGDCRPSKRFAEIGKDSTVLVHEATFDDDMHRDAKAKKHSTMSEAIGVGLAMKAKRLILTHFSQRYQTIPSRNALDNFNVQFNDPEVAAPGDEEAVLDTPLQDPAMPDEDFELQQNQVKDTSYRDTTQQEPDAPIESSAATINVPGIQVDMKIAYAFDFLNVRVRDIEHLERFHPAVRRLFELLEQKEKQKAASNPSDIARREREEARKQRTKEVLANKEKNEGGKEKRKRGRGRSIKQDSDMKEGETQTEGLEQNHA